MIVAVPALIFVCVAGPKTVRSLEYNKELKTIASSLQGDIVKFGRYDTDISLGKEQLEWIVVSVENNRYTLVTKHGIAGATYNQSHKEITWSDCDLRKRLNSKEFTDIFSDKEKSILLENEDGDIISLLTAEEADAFFESDLTRQLTSTNKAKARNVNVNDRSKVNYWDYEDNKVSWWWLKGDETPSVTAPIVNYEGEIVKDEKYVNKPNGAIRPVIVVEIKR